MTTEDQREVEVRARRGRCVDITRTLGNTPGAALWKAPTDFTEVESADYGTLTGAEMVRVIHEPRNG